MAGEGSAEQPFFIYDHTVLQKEEDDINDAILYFYPPMTSLDERCALCGQLMGMVTFFVSVAGSAPSMYRLQRTKVVVRHAGRYTLALGGDYLLPDRVLCAQLDFVYTLFRFYHRNLDDVTKLCKKQDRDFVDYLGIIWDTYIPFARYYGDDFMSAMRPLPTLQLARGQSSLFLRAAHLLEACQRAPGVLAGCLLVQNRVVCTQLTPEMTSRLLLLRPHQTHLPCRAINTDFTLPVGVRLLAVYVTEEEETALYPPWADYETGPSDQEINKTGPADKETGPATQGTMSTDQENGSINKETASTKQESGSSYQATETTDQDIESANQENGSANQATRTADQKSGSTDQDTRTADQDTCQGSVTEATEEDQLVSSGPSEENLSFVSVDGGSTELLHSDGGLDGDVENPEAEACREERGEHRRVGNGTERNLTNEGQETQETTEQSLCQTESANDKSHTVEVNSYALSISQTILAEAAIDLQSKAQRISQTLDKEDEIHNITKEEGKVCATSDVNKICNHSQPLVQSESIRDSKGADSCNIKQFAEDVSQEILAGVISSASSSNVDKSNNVTQSTPQITTKSVTTNQNTSGRVSDDSKSPCSDGESATSREDAIYDSVTPERPTNSHPESMQNVLTNSSLKCDVSDRDIVQCVDALSADQKQSQESRSGSGPLVDQLSAQLKGSTSLEMVPVIECSSDSTLQLSTVTEGSRDEQSGGVEEAKGNVETQEHSVDICDSSKDEPTNRLPLKLTIPDYKRSGSVSPTSPTTLPLTPLQPASRVALFKAVKEASKMAAQTYEAMTSGETSPEGSPFQGLSRSSSRGGLAQSPDPPQGAASPADSPMKKLISLTKPIVIAKQKTGPGRSRVRALPGTPTGQPTSPVSEQVTGPADRGAAHEVDHTVKAAGAAQVRKARLRGPGRVPRGADGLQEVDLYIQGNADLLLLVVMETGASQNKDTVHTMWQSALPQLGDLDLYIKQRSNKGAGSKKKDVEYNYLSYNSSQQSLSGNMTQPVTVNENKFCETTIKMHEDFTKSETLTDVILRSHNSYVYGHRAAGQETFFQQHGSARTVAGFPNEREVGMATDNVAYQKMFSEEKSLII